MGRHIYSQHNQTNSITIRKLSSRRFVRKTDQGYVSGTYRLESSENSQSSTSQNQGLTKIPREPMNLWLASNKGK